MRHFQRHDLATKRGTRAGVFGEHFTRPLLENIPRASPQAESSKSPRGHSGISKKETEAHPAAHPRTPDPQLQPAYLASEMGLKGAAPSRNCCVERRESLRQGARAADQNVLLRIYCTWSEALKRKCCVKHGHTVRRESPTSMRVEKIAHEDSP